MARFALTTVLAQPYDVAVDAVRAALGPQRFGILTEIDRKATLKAELDVDTAPQVILGACQPALARRALTAEPSVGTVLPSDARQRCTAAAAALETRPGASS